MIFSGAPRAARRLPERGRIGIFNRSYYEEVLVVRVHPKKDIWAQNRVFYRLANVKKSEKKRLFEFLRRIFQSEAQLNQDTERLKKAIASGSCTLSEWKPFSVIERSQTHRTTA
jgi:polyphosphate kinase 2 (PPK2 family)